MSTDRTESAAPASPCRAVAVDEAECAWLVELCGRHAKVRPVGTKEPNDVVRFQRQASREPKREREATNAFRRRHMPKLRGPWNVLDTPKGVKP